MIPLWRKKGEHGLWHVFDSESSPRSVCGHVRLLLTTETTHEQPDEHTICASCLRVLATPARRVT